MAVENRFVVIRHGVEAKTFMDKKSADEYDKMLDMADNLADIFSQSPIELNETLVEELSVYLATHRESVLVALLAKKAVTDVEVKVAKKSAAKASPLKVVDENLDNVGEIDTKAKVSKISKAKSVS